MATGRETNRRSVLKWAFVGVAALAGSIAAGVFGSRAPASSATQKMNLAGRSWRVLGLARGQLPAAGTQLAVTGELLGARGEKLGEFYSNSVFVGAPHGAGESAASYAETHHFILEAGSLVGSGTWYVNGPSRFAILGGTGRYAGATGTYEAIQRPVELGGDGSASFVFDLMTAGGANGGS